MTEGSIWNLLVVGIIEFVEESGETRTVKAWYAFVTSCVHFIPSPLLITRMGSLGFLSRASHAHFPIVDSYLKMSMQLRVRIETVMRMHAPVRPD